MKKTETHEELLTIAYKRLGARRFAALVGGVMKTGVKAGAIIALTERNKKIIVLGEGYYYDMAGRWAGLGPLNQGKACKKLKGTKRLLGRFRENKIRLMAEVL